MRDEYQEPGSYADIEVFERGIDAAIKSGNWGLVEIFQSAREAEGYR